MVFIRIMDLVFYGYVYFNELLTLFNKRCRTKCNRELKFFLRYGLRLVFSGILVVVYFNELLILFNKCWRKM